MSLNLGLSSSKLIVRELENHRFYYVDQLFRLDIFNSKLSQMTRGYSNFPLFIHYLVGGIPTPLKKYEFVSLFFYSQYLEK